MEIIKVKNASYARYEEVLLRRDNLKKEAEQLHLQFIMEFGDFIEESFKMKVECIRKKKEIAFCQQLANKGKSVNRNELVNFIENAMKEYYEELRNVVNDVKAAKKSKTITPTQLKKIKDTYYRLAKKIHPDIHPELANDLILQDYWNRISIAYQYNNLKDIEELETMVNMYLENTGKEIVEIEIDNIDSKILEIEKEIDEITSTNPYLYRILLGSETAIEEKRREYRNEIESYKKYSLQLDEVLATFEIEEMLS